MPAVVEAIGPVGGRPETGTVQVSVWTMPLPARPRPIAGGFDEVEDAAGQARGLPEPDQMGPRCLEVAARGRRRASPRIPA